MFPSRYRPLNNQNIHDQTTKFLQFCKWSKIMKQVIHVGWVANKETQLKSLYRKEKIAKKKNFISRGRRIHESKSHELLYKVRFVENLMFLNSIQDGPESHFQNSLVSFLLHPPHTGVPSPMLFNSTKRQSPSLKIKKNKKQEELDSSFGVPIQKWDGEGILQMRWSSNHLSNSLVSSFP